MVLGATTCRKLDIGGAEQLFCERDTGSKDIRRRACCHRTTAVENRRLGKPVGEGGSQSREGGSQSRRVGEAARKVREETEPGSDDTVRDDPAVSKTKSKKGPEEKSGAKEGPLGIAAKETGSRGQPRISSVDVLPGLRLRRCQGTRDGHSLYRGDSPGETNRHGAHLREGVVQALSQDGDGQGRRRLASMYPRDTHRAAHRLDAFRAGGVGAQGGPVA